MLGRLVERGLHDELKGTAYAIIDGVDGRTHHLVFSDLEMTGDAKPGAIVETRAYDDASAASAYRSPPDRTSRSRRRSRRPEPPGSIASFWPKIPHSAPAASAQTFVRRWSAGSIISSNRIWLDGKVSGLSSLAISSTRCADASSMRPLPNCRPTRTSPIVHRRKVSMSRASIASASRLRRDGSP